MSIAKGGRGVKAPYTSESYRMPSPIKPAVMRLAELYRQELWDGSFESLQIGQKQDCLALLEQVQNIVSNYESRLADTSNWTEVEKLLNNIREIMASKDSSSEAL